MADINKLLEERGEKYGPAWLLTADAMRAVNFARSAVASSPLAFNWVIILNKLTRALQSPTNPDHWTDIAGYAQLSVDWLEEDRL